MDVNFKFRTRKVHREKLASVVNVPSFAGLEETGVYCGSLVCTAELSLQRGPSYGSILVSKDNYLSVILGWRWMKAGPCQNTNWSG